MTETVRTRPAVVEHLDRGPLDRHELAAIIARDIPPGSYVNLGIGQPTLVADYLAPAPAWSCTRRTACSGWARPPRATTSTPT
ncbi:MAG: 3-oxoadipate CoA-transferase, beta subunit [Mycobacterium sp.]|jgi:hypothetical protein|nr:3-oxoadipate CoA-transferase, beta subunit [Mycobacterium sp.]